MSNEEKLSQIEKDFEFLNNQTDELKYIISIYKSKNERLETKIADLEFDLKMYKEGTENFKRELLAIRKENQELTEALQEAVYFCKKWALTSEEDYIIHKAEQVLKS